MAAKRKTSSAKSRTARFATAKSSSRPSAAASAFGGSRATLSAVENGRQSAQSMARFGTEAVRDFIASGAEEAQKAHEKMFAIGRDGADNTARMADAATRGVNDVIAISRDYIEAAVESGNTMIGITKALSSELFNYANSSFSDNVEISKDVFSCRTGNEFLDIYNRWTRLNVGNYFNEMIRLSELSFQFASEAAEPINERFAEATERFSRSLTNAA